MSTLAILQVAASVVLIGLILIQERSSDVSGLLGGGGGDGGFYRARRGLEKGAFVATLIVTAIFIALSLANLLTQQ